MTAGRFRERAFRVLSDSKLGGVWVMLQGLHRFNAPAAVREREDDIGEISAVHHVDRACREGAPTAPLQLTGHNYSSGIARSDAGNSDKTGL